MTNNPQQICRFSRVGVPTVCQHSENLTRRQIYGELRDRNLPPVKNGRGYHRRELR